MHKKKQKYIKNVEKIYLLFYYLMVNKFKKTYRCEPSRTCDGPEEKIGYRDAPNLINNSSKDISCSSSSEL